MAIFLISEAYLKENSPLSQAIEYKALKQHITTGQDIYIQQILGTALYNQILEKFASETLTDKETALVLLLKKVLCLRVYEIALPYLAFQSTQAGLVTKSGDNYQPAGKSMVEYVVNETRDKAELYTKTVQEYLRQNVADFQNWIGGNFYGVQATNQSYDSDLYFDEPYNFKYDRYA